MNYKIDIKDYCKYYQLSIRHSKNRISKDMQTVKTLIKLCNKKQHFNKDELMDFINLKLLLKMLTKLYNK